MAEPERIAATPHTTAHETEETVVHPQHPTDQLDSDQRDTAVHPQPGADQRDTAVHPQPGADRHDTAVLPDGDTPWTPPTATGTTPGTGPGAGYGTGHDEGYGTGTAAGEAASPGRRSPDLLALTAAAVFCLVAVLGLVGTSVPGWLFGGGFVAVVLVVAGAGLLVSELRRPRT